MYCKVVSLFLVFVSILCSQPSSPVIFLEFENNLDGLSAESIGGSINGVANYVEGLQGKALFFSASGIRQAISFNNYKLRFAPENEFSVQLWFKTTQDSTISATIFADKNIIPGDVPTDKEVGVGFHLYDNTWGWNIGSGDLRLAYLRDNGELTPVNDGKWHQFTMTYEGSTSTIRLYLDGKNRVTYHIGKMGSVESPNELILGADADGANDDGDRFEGAIDNFGVWERSLTLEEIEESYRKFYNFQSYQYEQNIKKLRVAIWNTEHGALDPVWYDGRVRVAEMLEAKEIDIALIQENYSSGDMVSGHLGTFLAIGADRSYLDQGSNIAIHSRFPIEAVWADGPLVHCHLTAKIKISETQYLYAGSNWYGGATALQTILDFNRERINEGDSIPYIWGGDFNSISNPDNQQSTLHLKMENEGFVDADLEATGSTGGIDYLYHWGVGLKAVDFTETKFWPGGFPSDHPLLIADLDLNYSTGETSIINSIADFENTVIHVMPDGKILLNLNSKSYMFELFDIRGRLVKQVNELKSINNASHLVLNIDEHVNSSGFYLFKVYCDGREYSKGINIVK